MSARAIVGPSTGGVLAFALTVVVGCGGGDGTTTTGTETFPDTPFASVASDSGQLRVDARSGPEQPPTRGVNDVELTVVDANGVARDGLAVEVVPWMTAMGHGASVTPTVTPRGQGRYLVTNVVLFMPGRWELRTAITGTATDHATVFVAVP